MSELSGAVRSYRELSGAIMWLGPEGGSDGLGFGGRLDTTPILMVMREKVVGER